MAILNTGILTNLTEYPNSFKRQKPSPLEAYSVFYSLEDAQTYANSNLVAYVGQIITVIKDDIIKSYKIIDTEGTLKELIDEDKALELSDRLDTLEGTEEGSVVKSIRDSIDALDATIASGDVEAGTGVKVTVTETNGKITAVAVDGNYNNTYDAKGAAAKALEDATSLVNGERDRAMNEEGKLSTRLDKVETFFEGAYTDDGKPIRDALDTLVEIQEYISLEGESASNLVNAVVTNTGNIEDNTKDIKTIQNTLTWQTFGEEVE